MKMGQIHDISVCKEKEKHMVSSDKEAYEAV